MVVVFVVHPVHVLAVAFRAKPAAQVVHISCDDESKQAAPGVAQLGGVVHAVHVLAVAFRAKPAAQVEHVS